MIFTSTHTFLECLRVCLNSNFLAGIENVHVDLVGLDLGS
jgi:hypothetical protein